MNRTHYEKERLLAEFEEIGEKAYKRVISKFNPNQFRQGFLDLIK